jgi:hypothetical protein
MLKLSKKYPSRDTVPLILVESLHTIPLRSKIRSRTYLQTKNGATSRELCEIVVTLRMEPLTETPSPMQSSKMFKLSKNIYLVTLSL